jgi:hypothetical protein
MLYCHSFYILFLLFQRSCLVDDYDAASLLNDDAQLCLFQRVANQKKKAELKINYYYYYYYYNYWFTIW